MTEEHAKTCTHCGEAKSLSDFYRDSYKGHQSWCKVCQRTRARNAEATRRATAKWKAKNREKVKAHTKVRVALTSGALARPGQCERCEKPCHPHAHHDDYSKPLDVQWLCRDCHVAEHPKEISRVA